jgi:hypothetical protein
MEITLRVGPKDQGWIGLVPKLGFGTASPRFFTANRLRVRVFYRFGLRRRRAKKIFEDFLQQLLMDYVGIRKPLKGQF